MPATLRPETDGRHSRPYCSHCPSELRNAMYVEGGPEAQLYVRTAQREVELVGRYATGIIRTNANPPAWPVPNVIGVVRTAQEPKEVN